MTEEYWVHRRSMYRHRAAASGRDVVFDNTSISTLLHRGFTAFYYSSQLAWIVEVLIQNFKGWNKQKMWLKGTWEILTDEQIMWTRLLASNTDPSNQTAGLSWSRLYSVSLKPKTCSGPWSPGRAADLKPSAGVNIYLPVSNQVTRSGEPAGLIPHVSLIPWLLNVNTHLTLTCHIYVDLCNNNHFLLLVYGFFSLVHWLINCLCQISTCLVRLSWRCDESRWNDQILGCSRFVSFSFWWFAGEKMWKSNNVRWKCSVLRLITFCSTVFYWLC